MNKEQIVKKLYASYGTDSGVLFGISDKQVVEAIVGFTILQLDITADLTEHSPDSNNPTLKFLADENRALKDTNAQLKKTLNTLVKRIEDNWDFITSGNQNGTLTALLSESKTILNNIN